MKIVLGRPLIAAVVGLGIALAPNAGATTPDPACHSLKQFLAQDDTQHPYRASRHLEAVNGSRKGWLDATTEYSTTTGFRYQVTAEGGSKYICTKVLRGMLQSEGEAIAKGEVARSSIDRVNYALQPNGIDADGLANVLVSPRRKERTLIFGTIFLNAIDGDLVRMQGRLAKSPSFWIKEVNIVRSYQRIAGAVVPVSLASIANLRFLGPATLRMTYAYSEIDGTPVAPSTRSVQR
jgi:hypothetical protein